MQNCREAMDWFSERLSQQYLALEKADIAAASIAQQRTNIRKVRERLRMTRRLQHVRGADHKITVLAFSFPENSDFSRKISK